MNRAKVRLLGVVVAAGLIAISSGTAAGQPGGGGQRGGGPGGGFGQTPTLNSRQLERYTQILNLTADQKEAAKTLFEGYQEQTRKQEEEMRKKTEAIRQEFRETQDQSVWEGMRESMTKARKDREKTEQQYFDDLKSTLTPAQAEKWPSVERARRRDTTLQRGRISGEGVDVIRLVDDLKLAEADKKSIVPILDLYEEEVDRALVARNAVYEEIMTNMRNLMQGGDMDAAQKQLEKGRDAGTRVRDVNRKYQRQISEALPEAKRSDFTTAVEKACFPQIYRDSQVQGMLAAAAKLTDLDDAQKTSLKSLTENFGRDISAVRAKMTKVQEDEEGTITAERLMGRFGRGGGPGGQNDEGPMADLRRQRRDVEKTTEANLKKLLTPAQMEKMPKPEDAPNGDGGGAGGGRQRARNGGGNRQGT